MPTQFLLISILCLSCFNGGEERSSLYSDGKSTTSFSPDSGHSQEAIPDTQTDFDQLNASSDWILHFTDTCTDEWQTDWFLDGQLATVENSEKGMTFSAGKINRDDAHHAVLWTKASFKGDVKIEYEYTRTDSQIINVNILYIQATGIGTPPYDRDISKWNDLRKVPKMSTYFNNMNALHISYAAFGTVNDDPETDYIRVRKYPVTKDIEFKETEVPPSYDRTGLFLPGETYQITVIKTKSELFLHVKGRTSDKLFSWHLRRNQGVSDGRIGLRHMYTRSANYSDFKISVK